MDTLQILYRYTVDTPWITMDNYGWDRTGYLIEKTRAWIVAKSLGDVETTLAGESLDILGWDGGGVLVCVEHMLLELHLDMRHSGSVNLISVNRPHIDLHQSPVGGGQWSIGARIRHCVCVRWVEDGCGLVVCDAKEECIVDSRLHHAEEGPVSIHNGLDVDSIKREFVKVDFGRFGEAGDGTVWTVWLDSILYDHEVRPNHIMFEVRRIEDFRSVDTAKNFLHLHARRYYHVSV